MYLLQILRGESGLTTERMRKLNVEINAKVVQVLEPSVHCCACTVWSTVPPSVLFNNVLQWFISLFVSS